jgi:hypothetical protein
VTRFEIRPLGLWDRPVTENRASSGRFRSTWDQTVSHLLDEVEHLGGELIVVQIDADADDVRRDGMLRARAKVGFPGVKVSFDSTHGPLTYATDAYEQRWPGDMPSWQANVRAIALGLEALRAVDRYGITRSGEQYRGWTALAAKPAEKELTVDEAARLLAEWTIPLCRPQDMRTEDQVNRAFRAAARVHHPDVAGGSADAFRLISSARDVLVAAIRDGAR